MKLFLFKAILFLVMFNSVNVLADSKDIKTFISKNIHELFSNNTNKFSLWANNIRKPALYQTEPVKKLVDLDCNISQAYKIIRYKGNYDVYGSIVVGRCDKYADLIKSNIKIAPNVAKQFISIMLNSRRRRRDESPPKDEKLEKYVLGKKKDYLLSQDYITNNFPMVVVGHGANVVHTSATFSEKDKKIILIQLDLKYDFCDKEKNKIIPICVNPNDVLKDLGLRMMDYL